MTVKTYNIKGELYATYIGVSGIFENCGERKFTLKYGSDELEKLSVQEVRIEVEQ